MFSPTTVYVPLRCPRAEKNKIRLIQYKVRISAPFFLDWMRNASWKKTVTWPLLLVYVTGLFRLRRLRCKQEHSCSFCKRKQLIRNIALTRIRTLNRVFCTATHTVNDKDEKSLSPLQSWSSQSLISTVLHLFRLASSTKTPEAWLWWSLTLLMRTAYTRYHPSSWIWLSVKTPSLSEKMSPYQVWSQSQVQTWLAHNCSLTGQNRDIFKW